MGKKYKGKFFSPMKDFVSTRIDHQSMYFMSTRFFKDNIDGFCIPQLQLAYICDTNHNLHKYCVVS